MLAVRGINYDVGTDYAGTPTRARWRPPEVRRDLVAIRDELCCTTVNLYGSDPDRLTETAAVAVDLGLDVWVQPRLIDRPAGEVLEHLARTAGQVDGLRSAMPSGRKATGLVLNMGCEWSVFTEGILPGANFNARAATLAKPFWWPLLPWFNRRLGELLRRAQAVARAEFAGQVTYSAGLWERVDWSGFDLVGVNYYRFRPNRRRYEKGLHRLHRHAKPVVITEFGCGAFRGADDLGPQSHTILGSSPDGPRVPVGYARDEQVQATYLADLLGCFQRTRMHGAFVFEFSEPYKPHSADPAKDLDMTGYAVVTVSDEEAEAADAWRPKAAFHELARIYGNPARSADR